MSLKRLQEETGTKMSILGKGSMKDKAKVISELGSNLKLCLVIVCNSERNFIQFTNVCPLQCILQKDTLKDDAKMYICIVVLGSVRNCKLLSNTIACHMQMWQLWYVVYRYHGYDFRNRKLSHHIERNEM